MICAPLGPRPSRIFWQGAVEIDGRVFDTRGSGSIRMLNFPGVTGSLFTGSAVADYRCAYPADLSLKSWTPHSYFSISNGTLTRGIGPHHLIALEKGDICR